MVARLKGGVFLGKSGNEKEQGLQRILKGLNPPQVEAVTHEGGPLLILAGAGSGKTTVLTRRVAYLIHKGVAPSSILAITFTNKAADELRTRIDALLGSSSKGMWAMTFHAACARILRVEWHRAGGPKQFFIADSHDQTKIIKAALKTLDMSEKQYPAFSMKRAISAAKDVLVGPEEYARRAETFYETKVAQVYSEYQRLLRAQDSLDFDDLLFETVVLFEKNPEILAKYQARWAHILVDEYQDTNRAQYELTRLLASSHHNIAVVGDDDQSIYTFRGADIRNILDFEKDYPTCRVVKLEENYRSTAVILDSAYHVVSHNRGRKDKRLWTKKDGGLPITVYRAQSGQDEARFVASEVEGLRGEGFALGSIAVLYRVNAQSRALEEAFVAHRVPYAVLSGRRFYERKHVKDALSFLRLLVNPRDLTSLERIANEPPRGLGPASVRRIAEHAKDKEFGLIEALVDANNVPGLQSRQRDAAAEFGGVLSDVRAKLADQPLHHTVNEVLERTSYLGYLDERDPRDSEGRIADLDDLMVTARMAHENGEDLVEFLERCSLVAEQDDYDEKRGTVIMGTLHSAKGLEFDVVFLVGMEEGLMPHARSLGDQNGLEEERRLMYVGMTRAKKLLYISYAESREMSLGASHMTVSRFVAEIPRNLLEARTWEW